MTDHINSGNGDKKNDELISATNPSLSVHLVDEMEKCLQECPSYIQVGWIKSFPNFGSWDLTKMNFIK